MQKQIKAIFLDRDGLINDNSKAYYIYRKEDFSLNEGVLASLKSIYKKGYLLIIITNQGGIAKKKYSHADVEDLNNYLKTILEKEGIFLSEIYYCPHHSDISNCLCRKPDSLLFEKAMAKYGIKPEHAYMIGDSDRDVISAKKVGIKGIKVPANSNLYETLKQTELFFLLD